MKLDTFVYEITKKDSTLGHDSIFSWLSPKTGFLDTAELEINSRISKDEKLDNMSSDKYLRMVKS